MTAKLISEGKTKKIWQSPDAPDVVIVESKDDITRGNGAVHDVIRGKGESTNAMTANVFRLFRSCGLPVAFLEKIDATRFRAMRCTMIRYEVVVRREAHGSFLKRHPDITEEHHFPRLIVEFFLKTGGKQWHGASLPVDDPFVRFVDGRALLYLPDHPMASQEPFLVLDDFPLREAPTHRDAVVHNARRAFSVLEKAWHLLGLRLVDCKMEFGITPDGSLVIADTLDNDSWRLVEDGRGLGKHEVYTKGAPLDTVAATYHHVADLTRQFHIPRQQLLLWRGSASDDLASFEKAIDVYGARDACVVRTITRSVHKETVRAAEEIARYVHEIPDTVVVAFVGRSNGAGPILSALTHVPVITVPATWKEFPNDIWSSLRAPSDVSVMTVLEPANAVLAALQILAMRNPRLSAALRLRQEERFRNVLSV